MALSKSGLEASQAFASAAAADRECYHHPHGLLQLAFVSTHGAAATRYSTAKKVSRWSSEDKLRFKKFQDYRIKVEPGQEVVIKAKATDMMHYRWGAGGPWLMKALFP
ncbi:hypothetical protein COO60DRAFT_1457909 [Scenedesmus sp. NREL 46B-D3]|nr:hypothetical protein COO60DRAFT_1457909 [Scenedesmus sp. NREL 46B-D3]